MIAGVLHFWSYRLHETIKAVLTIELSRLENELSIVRRSIEEYEGAFAHQKVREQCIADSIEIIVKHLNDRG